MCARGLKDEEIPKNIILLDCYNVAEQEQYLKHICGLLDKDESIHVIIIDSIIVHFRSEFSGRSALSERQQRLNKVVNCAHLQSCSSYNEPSTVDSI